MKPQLIHSIALQIRRPEQVRHAAFRMTIRHRVKFGRIDHRRQRTFRGTFEPVHGGVGIGHPFALG
jgi:hypothetical protein